MSVMAKISGEGGACCGVPGLTLGKLAIALGLVLVLLARGCDSVGNRGVSREGAKVEEARMEIDKRIELADRETDKKEYTKEDRKEDQEDLDELRNDAKEASIDNTMNAYWRECLFVLGSIVLVLGLLATGFTGSGAERIICLIMLAIITFSIFVVGTPWISSIKPPSL